MFWKEYKDKQETCILQKWGGGGKKNCQMEGKMFKAHFDAMNSFAECQQVRVSFILSLRVR